MPLTDKTPAFVSKSRFADEVLGSARSWVSKLGKQGKLVLNEQGLVNVHATLQVIQAGYGAPERGRALDRAQRGTQAAAGPVGVPGAAQSAPPPAPPVFPDHREKSEYYDAEQKRVNYEERCRELIPAAELRQVVANAATAIRVRLEAWPDRLAPQLAPITDESTLRSTLAGEVEALLEDMAHSLGVFLQAQPNTGNTTH